MLRPFGMDLTAGERSIVGPGALMQFGIVGDILAVLYPEA